MRILIYGRVFDSDGSRGKRGRGNRCSRILLGGRLRSRAPTILSIVKLWRTFGFNDWPGICRTFGAARRAGSRHILPRSRCQIPRGLGRRRTGNRVVTRRLLNQFRTQSIIVYHAQYLGCNFEHHDPVPYRIHRQHCVRVQPFSEYTSLF